MIRLIRIEWLKLRTMRTGSGLLAGLSPPTARYSAWRCPRCQKRP